jgi:hypothetical protein
MTPLAKYKRTTCSCFNKNGKWEISLIHIHFKQKASGPTIRILQSLSIYYQVQNKLYLQLNELSLSLSPFSCHAALLIDSWVNILLHWWRVKSHYCMFHNLNCHFWTAKIICWINAVKILDSELCSLLSLPYHDPYKKVTERNPNLLHDNWDARVIRHFLLE